MKNNIYEFGKNSRIEKSARILGSYKEGDDILKAAEEHLSKAEGSRGGKVIGHTKSGKPIYEKADHSSHEKFSFKDHIDASNAHHKRAEKHFNTKTHEKFSTEKDEQFAHEKEAKKKFKKDNPDYHMGKFDKEHLGYHTTSKSDAR